MYRSVQFILKGYDSGGAHLGPAGLWNSANLVSDMLVRNGVRSEVVTAVDNNSIDALVHAFNPQVAIVEALWVVPTKFPVLQKLYRNVEWNVRIHSEIPFVSTEGVAIDWIKGYFNDGIQVSCNSKRMQRDLQYATGSEPIYLPNYYNPAKNVLTDPNTAPGFIDIACCGAIRPLKNQLLQAIAAVRFANDLGRHLRFHMNTTRQENNGADSVLKNIRALFAGSSHTLVEHPWLPHDQFLQLLRTMDLGMQVSLSETYNLTSADMVNVGLPIVVSDEVSWASQISKVDANDCDSIVEGLKRISKKKTDTAKQNTKALANNAKQAEKIWLDYLS